MQAKRNREEIQYVFSYGFGCMFKCSKIDPANKLSCTNCNITMFENEYKQYRQQMDYSYLAVRGENVYHVPMKIKTYPVGHVPTHR